jgi:hypothetical protein
MVAKVMNVPSSTCALRRFFAAVARHFKAPQFDCADCERVQSCGLKPSCQCTIELMQREQDPTGLQLRLKKWAFSVRSVIVPP